MHPTLGECYILTFSLTGIKGVTTKSTKKAIGEYIFDDLQFSFNVNKNYENTGCRGILANLGTAILKFSKNDLSYQILTKPKIPWKVLIPIKCFSKSNANKIDYSFHQTQTKDLPFVINRNKSVGAINFRYCNSLEYNAILQSNTQVTIFNPLAYRIRSEIDYLKGQIKNLIIEEPLKEVFILRGGIISLSHAKPINSLFNLSYQIKEQFNNNDSELDKTIQEKLQQQYANPILESNISSLLSDFYLNNHKPLKISGLIKFDNKTMLYSHNFIEEINLNNIDEEQQPVNPKRPVLILPTRYNNWRGAIETKFHLKTINGLLTINIFQKLRFKHSLFNNVKIIKSELIPPNDKNYYQDFSEKLIIDIEQIKWWFTKGTITTKEYENFILGINTIEK